MRESEEYDITQIRAYDLYFGLTMAIREGDYESSYTSVTWRTYDDPEKVFTPTHHYASISCADIRAELERRRLHQVKDLKDKHTRELMKMLDYARKFGGWYSPCDKSERMYYGWRYEDIKAELATRPHVPNKKEGRALRQEAARQARSRKSRRA